jgi:putative SOS response-associated peptidase YedK
VVRRHPKTGQRHLDLLEWGLLPHWSRARDRAQRPINARAETIAISGLFQEAFARRRAIVPASAFYEWKAIEGGKQPYAIARVDGQPMAFAGLWEALRQPGGAILRTFAIITTDASPDIVGLHDRMPVILERRTGRPGWARRMAIPVRCCVPRRPARSAYGQWTKE